jgi:hypothetical protein
MRSIGLTLQKFTFTINKAYAAVHGLRLLLFWFFGLLMVPLWGSAQQNTRPTQKRGIIASDTLDTKSNISIVSDSLLILSDTLSNGDSTKIMPSNGITTEITYFAEDSIVTDFKTNRLFLYKKAWFEYGTIRLDADLIIIDWEKSEILASGVTDSLGNVLGNPFFKDGQSVYEIRKEMRYNFKTKKAVIKDVVTEQQDGILRGETIKKTAKTSNAELLNNRRYRGNRDLETEGRRDLETE